MGSRAVSRHRENTHISKRKIEAIGYTANRYRLMRVVDKSIHDCHESTRLRLEDTVTVVGIRKLAAWEGEKTGEKKKIGEEKTREHRYGSR